MQDNERLVCTAHPFYDDGERTGWCKNMPVVHSEGDKRFCVFHAPADKKNLSKDDFELLVFKKMNEAQESGQFCDLGGTVFPDGFDFSKINEKRKIYRTSFYQCVFGGRISFERVRFLVTAQFSSAVFEGNANFMLAAFEDESKFDLAAFGEKANFYMAEFCGKCDLNGAKFGNETSYHKAKFWDDVSFIGSNFGTSIYFDEATFKGKVDFSNSIFENKVTFRETRFDSDVLFRDSFFGPKSYFTKTKFMSYAQFIDVSFGYIDFEEAEFIGNVVFHHVDFQETAYFNQTRFKKGLYFVSSISKDLIFRNVIAKTATFRESHFNGYSALGGIRTEDGLFFVEVDMTNIRLVRSDFDKIHFIACTWNKPREERIILAEESELTSEKPPENYTGWLHDLEETYRHLKQKFKGYGDENQASLFHVSEKRMLTRRTRRKENFFYWFILNSYRLSSGYGENPRRAAAILVSLLGLELLAFMFIGIEGGGQTWPLFERVSPYRLINLPKYIAATLEFLTLQHDPTYKMAAAEGWGAIARVAVFLLVYAQTLLFVFALRNKLRR